MYRECHSSKLWFPTHFLNRGRCQTMCAPEWHWWGLLCTPDGTAEWSHRLRAAGAMAEQSHQSRNIHWLCYSTDCHSHFGKNRSTVFQKQSFCLSSLHTYQVSFEPYPTVKLTYRADWATGILLTYPAILLLSLRTKVFVCLFISMWKKKYTFYTLLGNEE